MSEASFFQKLASLFYFLTFLIQPYVVSWSKSGSGSAMDKSCGSGSGYTTLSNREREQKGEDCSPHRKIVCFSSSFFYLQPMSRMIRRIKMFSDIDLCGNSGSIRFLRSYGPPVMLSSTTSLGLSSYSMGLSSVLWSSKRIFAENKWIICYGSHTK